MFFPSFSFSLFPGRLLHRHVPVRDPGGAVGPGRDAARCQPRTLLPLRPLLGKTARGGAMEEGSGADVLLIG